VREPIVHENAARQRENLRFVLKSAERRRKDEPVVIPLKFASVVHAFVFKRFVSKAFR
jgi:hypothetical protein